MEVSQEDREKVRTILKDVAEWIRKKYDLPIPEIRSFVKEMVDVSI